MEVAQGDSEPKDTQKSQQSFWFLLSLYLKSLVLDRNLKAVEEEVLPCLDEFHFLSKCTDHSTCISICKALRASGVVPEGVGRLLAQKLTTQGFQPAVSREQAAECISLASELLSRDFGTMVSVIGDCSSTVLEGIQTAEEEAAFNLKRSEVLEELFDRLDERRLLDLALSSEGEACAAFEDSELGIALKIGFQSSDLRARVQAMRLIGVSALKSYAAFKHTVGILDRALYLEDTKLREYIQAVLLDAIYIHNHEISFDAMSRYLLPFFSAPTTRMQLNAVLGVGRLLLAGAFAEDTEVMLAQMLQRYVSSNGAEKAEVDNTKVVEALHIFFSTYCGAERNQHQDELANTLVYMFLEKMDAGVILLSDNHGQLLDDPLHIAEAQSLRLVMKFVLHLCGEIVMDAVFESMCVNMGNLYGPTLLSREACLNWFKRSPI